MDTVDVLTDTARRVDAQWLDGRPGVGVADLEQVLGWTLKPEGLCQADVCIPVADRAALDHPAGVDLIAVADALGRPSVTDGDLGAIAVGVAATTRRSALRDRQAPDFTLPDLDDVPQTLTSWRGKKRLLVAFSSW